MPVELIGHQYLTKTTHHLIGAGYGNLATDAGNGLSDLFNNLNQDISYKHIYECVICLL